MKLTIERTALQKALAHVQSVVERRTTIPILSNVMIEGSEGCLSLTATDMDIAIVEKVPADVAGHGATTLPAHTLYDIVRKLPELPVVRLNADAVEEIDAPIMIKIGPSNTLPVDRSVLKKKDPVLSRASKKESTGPSVDETTQQQYELALAMLRENR